MTEPHKSAEVIQAAYFPEIREHKFQHKEKEWSVYFYQEYSSVLFEEATLKPHIAEKLKKLASFNLDNFRVQVSLDGTPLLAGIFFDSSEIRFYTPRLGRELFLIEQIEAHRHESLILGIIESSEYKRFHKHAEKVASMESATFPSEYQIVTQEHGLSDLLEDKFFLDLEGEIQSLVNELLLYLNKYKSSLFEKMSDFGLDLTARYALLRIHLLKFLAILPSLDHDLKGTQVKRILLESFRRLIEDSKKAKAQKKKGQGRPLPRLYLNACHFVLLLGRVFPAGPLSVLVRLSVKMMAKRFIAGESIDRAESSFKGLFETGRDVTLDQLGELVVSEKEADRYKEEVLKLIRGFEQHITKGSMNKAGILRAHVSIKVSALCSDFKPYAFEQTYKLVAPRLIEILTQGHQHQVFINIDAEHYDYRDLVLRIYERVLLETPELKDYDQTGIVLQAYLRDGAKHLRDIVKLAKKRSLAMPIRIVKGAYWDAETVEADAHSFNAPEFLNKEETDLHFRQLIVEIFKASPHVKLCLASHNFADHCFAEVLRKKSYPGLPEIEHQCLHMTYEALSVGMAKMNWVVRNYVPIGSLIVGMAYLVRRIMENSSQVGVLTIMRSHKKMARLESPMQTHQKRREEGRLFRDMTTAKLTGEFFNMTPVRLYLDDDFKAIESSLNLFKDASLGRHYQNNFLKVEKESESIVCSSDLGIKVGSITFGEKEDADRAVELSSKAYLCGDWAKAHWITRSSVLLKAADLMLARRNELSALVTYEAGKSVIEALGDVDEAIDFLNFYAREERKISVHSKSMVSRGPVVAITPWNFPLAIPTGMIAAPLVAGNTVILKSAEQTPLIAQKMIDLMHEAGVPEDVLIHLPGAGEVVGEALISHEKIAGVVFTGSKQVGVMIASKVGKRVYHNELFDISFPVRVITEMGGKNAVIVTANAELDETVAGILYSAFGHAGQKCSALSRIFVDESVKLRLIERLREACQDIKVGAAFDFGVAVNPVISKEDKERLQRQVKEASAEAQSSGGRVIIDRSRDELPGLCVGPSLIEVSGAKALDKNSYAQKEMFGPVVHITGFKGLDDAIRLYNSTDYALTGGVFSQSQDDIDYLSERMESGNIYINRTVTGARVAIEPFGGFKLSGTGPKAGSKAYLPSFHINSIKVQDVVNDNAEGSDYHFDLCGPSLLGIRQRVFRIEKAVDILLHHFESLFGGIYGEEKKVLLKFQKWTQKNLKSFLEKEHYNHKIPGQVSFNDFSLSAENAVMIARNSKPHFCQVMNVLGAISMGVGVTVMARNEKAYHWWSSFQGYMAQAGIGKNNFDAFFVSEKQLDVALANPKISFVLLDGGINEIKEDLNRVYPAGVKLVRMRAVLTALDAPNRTDFKRYCSQYVWVRSFAINTMRHGAPLDLEF